MAAGEKGRFLTHGINFQWDFCVAHRPLKQSLLNCHQFDCLVHEVISFLRQRWKT